VLLAVCVFAWGLKYKLSLYDPPRAVSHNMPAAKLLAGKERSVPLAGAQLRVNPVVPPLLSTLAVAFLALAAAKSRVGFGGWIGRSSTLRIVPACARSGNSFVRPPPRTR
jgi:hypothetical protein